MELRQLKYFNAVVEAKSLTRAADLLRLGQPALSNQIHKLEAELGERLFVRHSRGIQLTAAGHRLLIHARTVLRQIDVAREDVRGKGEKLEGLIRVGMPRSVSEIIAVDLIREAARRMPLLSIRIIENFSENIYTHLLGRELDIGLTYGSESSSRVAMESIHPQPLCLVSPRAPNLRSKTTVAFSNFVKLPLILGPPNRTIRRLLEATAAEKKLALNIVHEVDSFSATLSMVEAGLGHSVLPSILLGRALKTHSIAARTIKNPDLVRDLKIVKLAQGMSTRAETAVYALLVELLKRSPRGQG